MNDLVFGIKLEGNNSSLVSAAKGSREEFVALQKQTEAITATSGKMASAYSGIDEAMRKNVQTNVQTASSVNKLLDRYDPLGVKLRQLQADFKALDQAAAEGKIAGLDDARVDAVYSQIQKQIGAAGQLESSMNRASGGTAGMTRELIVLGHEAVSGNFSRMPGTMMVLAERSGFALSALASMNPVLLGIGATVAVGALAWYEWGKSAEEASNKALESAQEAEKGAGKAWSGVHLTIDEQITQLQSKMAGVSGQLESAQQKNASVTRTTDISLAQSYGREVTAKKSELWALQRQLDDLKEKQDQPDKNPNKSFLDALQREADTFGMTAGQIKIYEAAKKGIVGEDMQHVMDLAREIDAHNQLKQAIKDQSKEEAAAAKSEREGRQILIGLEKHYQSDLEKRQEALNAPLLSASEKALAEDMRQISKSAQDSRIALEEKNKNGSLSAEDYRKRLQQVTADELAQKNAVRALDTEQARLNATWEYGAGVAMRKYADAAENTAAQSEKLFTSAFKGMEDAEISFVQTSKMDMRSLGDTVVKELLRIQMAKMNAGIMGNLFGSSSSTPSGISESTSSSFGPTATPAGTTDYLGLAGMRASGGPVDQNSLYRVNENGPEMLSVGGNDYLMMGGGAS